MSTSTRSISSDTKVYQNNFAYDENALNRNEMYMILIILLLMIVFIVGVAYIMNKVNSEENYSVLKTEENVTHTVTPPSKKFDESHVIYFNNGGVKNNEVLDPVEAVSVEECYKKCLAADDCVLSMYTGKCWNYIRKNEQEPLILTTHNYDFMYPNISARTSTTTDCLTIVNDNFVQHEKHLWCAGWIENGPGSSIKRLQYFSIALGQKFTFRGFSGIFVAPFWCKVNVKFWTDENPTSKDEYTLQLKPGKSVFVLEDDRVNQNALIEFEKQM